jgi:predicted molibdopterin-dependent oxidoreductase YjgC
MRNPIQVRVDGTLLAVPSGTVVAAAVARAGKSYSRLSVRGAPRAALCGMGVCQECRVTVDGRAHQRGCLLLCRHGMEIETGDDRSCVR